MKIKTSYLALEVIKKFNLIQAVEEAKEKYLEFMENPEYEVLITNCHFQASEDNENEYRMDCLDSNHEVYYSNHYQVDPKLNFLAFNINISFYKLDIGVNI